MQGMTVHNCYSNLGHLKNRQKRYEAVTDILGQVLWQCVLNHQASVLNYPRLRYHLLLCQRRPRIFLKSATSLQALYMPWQNQLFCLICERGHAPLVTENQSSVSLLGGTLLIKATIELLPSSVWAIYQVYMTAAAAASNPTSDGSE